MYRDVYRAHGPRRSVASSSLPVTLEQHHNNVPSFAGRWTIASCAAHSFVERNLSALAITETELKLMAAAAIIGFRSSPSAG